MPDFVSTARRSRVAGVEGLRALAAGSIFVYHAWLYSAPDGHPVDLGYLTRFVLPHLASGVTLFFTLSGFLLYRPLASAVLGGTERPSTKTYFRNRALRIVPAYWVILTITGFLLGAVLVRSGPDQIGTGSFFGAPGQFLRNVLLVQNYSGASLDSGIGPAWSLAVEVMFYLVLPLLGWIALRAAAGSSNNTRRVVASLIPPSLALGIGWSTAALLESGTFANSVGSAIVARSFLNHADLFALGMALAVLCLMVEGGDVHLRLPWRPVMFLALVTVVGATVLLVDRGVIQKYQGALLYESLTSIACVIVLALVVLPSKQRTTPVFVRLLQWRPVVATGLASYSLFLWHEPIVLWLNGHGLTQPGSGGFWLNLLLLAVVAGVLSAGSYLLVEKPALAHKSAASRWGNVVPRPLLVPSGEVASKHHRLRAEP
jgi:peptidoglycan/LPS O-acetylase OafA/YrhL